MNEDVHKEAAMFVDFKALKELVTIEQVVTMLGLKLKQEGEAFRGACPACGGDTRTLIITPAKGAFYCHKAEKGGDLIALAAHVRDEKLPNAAKWIEANLGNSTVKAPVPSTSTSSQEPRQKIHGFDREKYRAGLDREHELLKDIPADLIERADLGVSTKGALKGVVLPLYDKDTGDFICYAAVSSIQLPKATVSPLRKAS